jgi:hypothetical protein
VSAAYSQQAVNIVELGSSPVHNNNNNNNNNNNQQQQKKNIKCAQLTAAGGSALVEALQPNDEAGISHQRNPMLYDGRVDFLHDDGWVSGCRRHAVLRIKETMKNK